MSLNRPTGSPLRYDLDRLAMRGRRIFGWGWLAHAERAVREMHLELAGPGWEKRLPVTTGLARKDVADAFPALVDAASSGFLVTGFVPALDAPEVALRVVYDDGSAERIALAPLGQDARPAPAARTLARLARAFWRRLKQRDFADLPARYRASRVAALDEDGIAAALAAPLALARAVRIIFDHDMGGGANQYRERRLEAWRAAGEAVVLCTYHLPSLDYRLRLFMPGAPAAEYRASSFVALEGVLRRAPVAELFVNSPVSFDEPLLLADWLARMRAAYPSTRLTVAMHDYFSVCPSFVLLDADGRFCGIPTPAECERCLARHAAPHVALSPPTRIVPWREAWNRCLRSADEIVCFSEDTRRLLERAHRGLANVVVRPHEPAFAPERRPRVDHAAPLVIGVVGTISEQKGASVVVRMVDRIEREHPDVRVVVLGTLDSRRASRQLTVSGAYAREELTALVERHRVNMFFFPSIWPETFSYVVAEMMALGLPIVAFDLGAPAERLRAHPLARLVPTVDADAALDAMLRFHSELALQPAAA